MGSPDYVDRAIEGERVFDLGQLSPGTLQELNRLVRFGVLTKRKDHWYPGLLPLKTVYELSLPNNLRKAS